MRSILSALVLLAAAHGFGAPADTAVSPAEAFAVPRPGRVFDFPRDHGSHPDFRIEWWYVTGHLRDDRGGRFGFQATFFRRAAPPPTDPSSAASPGFGDAELHLAHVALLEVDSGTFRHQERLNRRGWDAGADTGTLRVRNGNWSLQLVEDRPVRLRLVGTIRGDAAFDLDLRPAKPLVVFGTNGVSRKGASGTAASHYLTFPRLEVQGSLRWSETRRPITGQAWMDHEFSSSQLEDDQVGWDWASIQLHDGREVMCYRMRKSDGGTDPFSTLAWIDRDGRVTHLSASDFRLEPLGHWRSPRTGATYPSGWRLSAKATAASDAIDWRVQPLAEDQELRGTFGSVPYWEGACRILDASGKELGLGYVELTGYAGDLKGRLR